MDLDYVISVFPIRCVDVEWNPNGLVRAAVGRIIDVNQVGILHCEIEKHPRLDNGMVPG